MLNVEYWRRFIAKNDLICNFFIYLFRFFATEQEINRMNNNILKQHETIAGESELGKKSDYCSSYNPDCLYPISRAEKRIEIGIDPADLPFNGFDSWNHYEVSWLNKKGKPMVAIAEIVYDCHSPNIIESKSLKLYFNSFNNTKFNSLAELEQIIQNDLAQRLEATVVVSVHALEDLESFALKKSFIGESLDYLDVECSVYLVDPSFLCVEDTQVEETLCSDLLKSNCLVTNQPDWGSVQIAYKGKKINREGLLQYLVSYRNHNEFHEQCIERIFVDIMRYCRPESLTVYGRYTRRGGLDINPYRTTEKCVVDNKNIRLVRQ